MVAGLYGEGNLFEENCEGKVGSGGEGIYSEGGLRADGDEGKVFDVEVWGEGERERFFESVEVEERGACTGGG